MSPTAFPLHPGKHELPAVPDPAEHAARVRARHPGATLKHFAGIVIVYQAHVMEYADRCYRPRLLNEWIRGDLRMFDHHGHAFGLCGGFGVGAPAAALVLEQLITLGATRFITVGTAAALSPDLLPGTLVVCREALRDEGVSRHYLPPTASIRPSPDLTDHLVRTIRATRVPARSGPTWTTDAPYRETEAEVAQYGASGVLTADMEAAAVFAVAAYRAVHAAAVFAVADTLVNRRPHDTQTTQRALRAALPAAFSALLAASTAPHRGQ
ncbi:nucleoside phosphorylase [Streptomyces rapamycinicus]|uniref:Uridine phosphorylase n=1 Tax=Streptomyces rapamycinicus TaxID=1226757 RepID=A0ABR6LIA9_9ACTN|nr:nucleoside phosphorylase [Streptomyces rapamycinicus]MBB4781846.1 uridine phosphorylase [Streptomyces rapamycinicus]UTO62410.1 nucleoside phosphorylase [Streptomyces rapamycinicus]UTP30366.1 nucleoside phosphorylase [Streptomyces rapamycinicus NRRL 5491]